MVAQALHVTSHGKGVWPPLPHGASVQTGHDGRMLPTDTSTRQTNHLT